MIALLVATLVATVADPPVPGRPGELRGTVSHFDGSPVTRFTVNGISFDDAHGAFRILVPPEGTFRVVVRANGLAPAVIQVQGAEGKKLMMPDIMLGKGEDVLGEVVDAETERPIAGARAALADPAQIDRLRLVRGERLTGAYFTGRGGWFGIPRAPRCLALLVVSAPGYLTEFVPVNTREPLPRITLHRGGGLSGAVRDAHGMPAAGVRVVALSEDARDGAEGVTDTRGRYAFEGLRPGHYRVAALAHDGLEAPAVVADGAVAFAALEPKGKRLDLPEIVVGTVAERRAGGSVAVR